MEKQEEELYYNNIDLVAFYSNINFYDNNEDDVDSALFYGIIKA